MQLFQQSDDGHIAAMLKQIGDGVKHKQDRRPCQLSESLDSWFRELVTPPWAVRPREVPVSELICGSAWLGLQPPTHSHSSGRRRLYQLLLL